MRLQFWSFDIIFAIVIFSVSLILLILFWTNINTTYINSYHSPYVNIKLTLLNLVSELFSTGNPSNWNSLINLNSPSLYNFTPGILNTSGYIDTSKLATLMAFANYNKSDYDLSKYLLHVPYDYYIIIKGQGVNITIGSFPKNAEYISSEVIPSKINNKNVRVTVYVWSNISSG